jgi:hypothetical protein
MTHHPHTYKLVLRRAGSKATGYRAAMRSASHSIQCSGAIEIVSNIQPSFVPNLPATLCIGHDAGGGAPKER